MTGASQPPADDDTPQASVADESTAADAVRQLIADAQAAAASETALVRLCAALALQAVRSMSLWAMAALLFAFTGMLALAVGGVVMLVPLVGPWLAILMVPGGLLLMALLSALRVRGQMRALQRAITTAWR